MRAARIIFLLAGIYGILVLLPDYFMEGWIGSHVPPPITHPEFFYGFVGVGLVFQIIFLVISADPIRYRPLMLLSIFEKASYVIPCAILYEQGRLQAKIGASAIGDLVWGILFVVAYAITRPSASS